MQIVSYNQTMITHWLCCTWSSGWALLSPGCRAVEAPSSSGRAARRVEAEPVEPVELLSSSCRAPVEADSMRLSVEVCRAVEFLLSFSVEAVEFIVK